MPRRTRARGGLVAAAVISPLLLAGPAVGATPAQTDTPGTAQAIAELIQIDPAVGNLALTMRVGTAIAGHQNIGASSEARSVDLGFIGDILGGEGCNGGDPTIPPGTLPESVIANSADPEAADGYEGGVDGLVTSRAQADVVPSALAGSELEPLGVPGLAEITGGRTSASSTADGHVARAVSEVGRIEIAGGAIALEGLRWEATSRLLPERLTETDFSIGSLSIAGTAVPLPADDVLTTVQALIDPVLGPLGLELAFPRAVELDDGVELTPLTVGVVPGELRDGILGPILGALQPARASIDEFLLGLDCANSTYITVLDILVGAVTGAGYASVDVGGVIARSDEVSFTSLLQDLPPVSGTPPSPAPTADGTTPTPVSSAGGSGSATVPGTGGTPTATTVDTVPFEDEQATSVLQGGSRGGPLVGIGAVGLLAAAAIAEFDRRRMRKAQRSVPMS